MRPIRWGRMWLRSAAVTAHTDTDLDAKHNNIHSFYILLSINCLRMCNSDILQPTENTAATNSSIKFLSKKCHSKTVQFHELAKSKRCRGFISYTVLIFFFSGRNRGDPPECWVRLPNFRNMTPPRPKARSSGAGHGLRFPVRSVHTVQYAEETMAASVATGGSETLRYPDIS
jgi:hypothetical protein